MSGRMTSMASVAALVAIFLSVAWGQGPKPTIEKGLESQYALTTPTADNTDIVSVGAILTFLKRGLMAADASVKGVCVNNYKEGQIKPNAACQIMGGKVVFGQHVGGSTPMRTFVNGEKVFVTKIDVDRSKDAVSFDLFTDSYKDVRYRATLRFEFAKGALATADFAQVQALVSQVFTVTPPEAPVSAASSPAPKQAPVAPDAPPPPPPAPAPPAPTATVQADAPPPPPPPDPTSISIGDTTEQVIAKMGQPQKIVKAAAGKEFYVYKDMRVTFVNGKMTDAQ
jgi:hypothetical protein